MYNSKLYCLYTSLNDTEKRVLKKWVRAPFANQKEEIICLFDYLMSRKAYTSTTLSRYKIWEAIFTDLPFDYVAFRLLCSQSLKVLENMLVYLYHQQQAHHQQNRVLGEIYQRKHLKQYVPNYFDLAKEQLENQPYRNGETFLSQYQLEVNNFKLLGTEARDQGTNLQDILQHLNDFYLFEFLKHTCSVVSHQNVSKQTYEIPRLAEVIQFLDATHQQLKPSIQLYYYALMSLMKPKEETYFSLLLQGLSQFPTCFNAVESKDLYMIAINFCIKSVNSGKEAYLQTLFDIYQKSLKEGYFLEQNELSRYTFRNIISCALQLQAFDWIEAFIEEYSPFLDIKFRENQVNFNLARLYFAKGAFEKTTPILLQEDFGDQLLNLAAKTMLVKIYVETQEWELLDATLNNFTVYLNRQKGLGYHRDNYKNFIHFIRRITKFNPDSSVLTALRQEIEDAQPLTERKWLLNVLLK